MDGVPGRDPLVFGVSQLHAEGGDSAGELKVFGGSLESLVGVADGELEFSRGSSGGGQVANSDVHQFVNEGFTGRLRGLLVLGLGDVGCNELDTLRHDFVEGGHCVARPDLPRILLVVAATLWVIRGFVFAMFFGVIVGTYSTLYVAKNIVLMLGLDRSEKPRGGAKGEFANIDA